MASGGYPGPFERGHVISGLARAASMADVKVFHAGTKLEGDHVVTDGGRVLGVTALGDTLEEARRKAYEACAVISWRDAHYRRDIAARALTAKE
jgi:phosphoribosylamine--glycine ligase